MRRSLFATLAAAMVAATLAIGGTAFGQTASGTHQPRLWGIGIDIMNDAYHPPTMRVLPGQVIAVTNLENEQHSLTARDGSFNTGIYEAFTRWITAPTTPGRYKYSCLVHGPTVMKGILIVEG